MRFILLIALLMSLLIRVNVSHADENTCTGEAAEKNMRNWTHFLFHSQRTAQSYPSQVEAITKFGKALRKKSKNARPDLVAEFCDEGKSWDGSDSLMCKWKFNQETAVIKSNKSLAEICVLPGSVGISVDKTHIVAFENCVQYDIKRNKLITTEVDEAVHVQIFMLRNYGADKTDTFALKDTMSYVGFVSPPGCRPQAAPPQASQGD